MSERVFRYKMSPRCFRYREDAIMSHAPGAPGVFEFVTFGEDQKAQVLYIALASRSIAEDLKAHWAGALNPTVPDLLQKYPNLYFDYVEWSDAKNLEDLKDIASALCREHRPPHNGVPLPASGRPGPVVLKEVEIPLHSPTGLL